MIDKKYLIWGAGGLAVIVGGIYIAGKASLNSAESAGGGGGGATPMPLFIGGGGGSIPIQAPAPLPSLGGELWENPAGDSGNTQLQLAQIYADVQKYSIDSNERIQTKAINVVDAQPQTTPTNDVSSTATATRMNTHTAAQGVIDIVNLYGGLTDQAAVRIYDEAKSRGMTTGEVVEAMNRASAKTNFGRTFTAGELNAYVTKMGFQPLG